MSIDRYSQPTTGDLYLSENGKYVKYDDHYNEITRLKNVNKALQSQLTETEKYKPNKDSLFAVSYDFKLICRNESVPRMVYAHQYKNMIYLLNKLNEKKEVSNIRVYALNEVEIGHEITIKLPE